MTAPRRDGNHQSPFLEWIRAVPALDSRDYCISIQDNDVSIHQYAPRRERGALIKQVIENFQKLETKTFNAELPFAQRDTLQVEDSLLRQASIRNGRRYAIKIPDLRLGRAGCYRLVRYFGSHVLQMSADRPDTSDRLLWDGKEIDEPVLIEMLGFIRDPDHPTKLVDSRRHHLRPVRERYPQLFEVGRRTA